MIEAERPAESNSAEGILGNAFTGSKTAAIAAAGSLTISFLLFAAFSDAATFAKALIGAGGLLVLLFYPEFALAAFMVVGDLKGNERIAALFPCDLTLAAGLIVTAGIALNLLRKKRIAPLPPVYFLFVVLAGMMTASLLYTPNLSAGLDKLALFLTFTAMAIVAPFFVLTDARAMKLFLWCFGSVAYVICVASLAGLGGADRLVTPSDNTIGLGRMACVLAAIIWCAAVVGAPLRKRVLAYAALAVPLIAMIGSGSRGPAVAFALVVLASLLFDRRLILDVAALGAAGVAALPFVRIPESSFAYLGLLAKAQSLHGLLDFRANLLAFGWKLMRQHPLIGAGLGGFRYSSPNPGLYKWPHNIFLELACEVGIPAALISLLIFGSAIRESARQLCDAASPYFRLSVIAAALLCIGGVAAVTTGDINSDRSIWLFVSLVFVIRAYRQQRAAAGAPSSAEATGSRKLQDFEALVP